MKWSVGLLISALALAQPPNIPQVVSADYAQLSGLWLRGRFADTASLLRQLLQSRQPVNVPQTWIAEFEMERGNYGVAGEILRSIDNGSSPVARRKARLSLAVGNYAAAIKFALEGAKWDGKTVRKLNVALPIRYVSVGEYCLARGDYAVAVEVFAKAQRQARSDAPKSAREWNRAEVGTALAYLGSGQPEPAKKAAASALEAAEALWGTDSIPALDAVDALGLSELALGRHAEAAEALGQSLHVRRKLYGADHPKVVASLLHGALVYAHLGRKDDALSFLSTALQTERGLAVAPNGRWAMELLDAAEIYTLCGKPEEALTCLRNALPVLEPALGADAPRLTEARQRLSRLQSGQQ